MPPEGNRTDQAAREKAGKRESKRREDPAVRADHNKQERERNRRKRQDSAVREAHNRAERDRKRLQRDSLLPQIVAAEMYVDYQRLQPDWPEVPPTGLKFAVDPKSAGLTAVGAAAQVVPLEVPQTGPSASASSVPSFLADPYLDLDSPKVRKSVLRQGVAGSAYEAAKEWQTQLQDQTRLQEFGTEAALIPQDHPALDQAPSHEHQNTWPASTLLPPSAYGSAHPQSYSPPPATTRTEQTRRKGKAPQR
ncbi:MULTISPECIES: hypothetical protein [Streptomyces]|uniref:hypothetical protein n=1 Tax=Streptomyces TaxID=1883 RepID=UPI000AB62C32|nr:MULTISPECIES: hypothetical protein [Streptomyces]TFI30907.1 hypothetical protein E4P36_03975 [Streptomyces sp. 4R-3d]